MNNEYCPYFFIAYSIQFGFQISPLEVSTNAVSVASNR